MFKITALNNSYLIAAAFLAGAIVAYTLICFRQYSFRRYSFQNDGEAEVHKALKALYRPPDYHLLNHITIKHGDGTTQIDHILLSRFGVFVIETKDYKGWIFGKVGHKDWTQVIFGEQYKFRNPINQNMRHVQGIRELLDFLPQEVVRSAVVFVGDAKFKTSYPDGVFSLQGMIEFINSFEIEVMSTNRLQFCVGRIESNRYELTKQTDLDHVDYLRSRYGLRD